MHICLNNCMCVCRHLCIDIWSNIWMHRHVFTREIVAYSAKQNQVKLETCVCFSAVLSENRARVAKYINFQNLYRIKCWKLL